MMLSEILIIFLIIIVTLVFLIFFKSWHLHILFKNNNFDYNLQIKIKFLFLQISINHINNNPLIIINLNIFSFSKHLYTKYLNSNNKSNEVEEELDVEEESDVEEENITLKIKKITPLLLKSKSDLYQIIIEITKLIKFKYSKFNIDLGLGDNNFTIKLCNLIWALSAPLYPLNFIIVLTPKINENILKTNCDINFDIKLTNVLRIAWIIFKNKNLLLIIKMILGQYDDS